MGFQHGLSGMNAASKNLDLIGHNIANANTAGYKASRTEFSELFGSAVGAGSSSAAGQGVGVSGVTRQLNQGNVSVTGNNLDVAINGTGFLQLAMPDGSLAYTRSGSLQINKDGKLVNQQGAQVLGFPTNPTTGTALNRSVESITVPVDKRIVGQKTSELSVKLNVDGGASTYDAVNNEPPYTTYSASLNIYNSQGQAIPVDLYFTKTSANTWEVSRQVDGNTRIPISTVEYDNDGKFVSQNFAAPSLAGQEVTANEADGMTPFTVKVDLSDTTQFASPFKVSQLKQDGYASGDLNGVSIEPDGTLRARYSNGLNLSQGKLALVNFNNPQGLASTAGGNLIETVTSGRPVAGEPNSGHFGSLQSGALEDSNVDLTAELVSMMTAQRSYQANAQTLKTQDQLMSTLVNLR
ncbi:MAG: flagellar hook protein FlgE [Polaromonas sp.]|jgi:flagellar hook protein FlgE